MAARLEPRRKPGLLILFGPKKMELPEWFMYLIKRACR